MKSNEKETASRGWACLAAAFALALPASAGIKYWDNPEFKAYDVGDYVQDGLVLNYDGIRNAGADLPHDPAATTWKNLGSGGATYDMVKKGSPTSSYWTGSGFYFEGKTWFVVPNKVALPNAYEMETLVDAAYTKQTGIGYILFTSTVYPRQADGGWAWSSVAIRQNGKPYSQTIDGTSYAAKAVFNTTSANTAYRPALLDDSYEYLTALANKTYASFFTGLEEPSGVPGRIGLSSGKTALGTTSLYFYLGGHNTDGGGETSVGEPLIGTIRNFRFYSAPLSYEQRAWNRVVDEARYFRRRGAIPVTNVVVAVTGISGVEDDHYALDEEGYTFTVPASRTVEGKRYALGGYTLETWNGSAWVSDGAGTHSGNAVALADTSAKVRVTWQYAAAAGEGRLAHYDVGDYVQDGLGLHFDGIRNAGAGLPHDWNAATWKNLGSESFDLTLKNSAGTVLSAPTDGSAWGADGFVYKGVVRFGNDTARAWGPSYTVQVLVDAKQSELKNKSGANYIFGTAWNKCSLSYYGQAARGLELHTQDQPSGVPHYGPYLPATSLAYANAILDSSDKSAKVFTGTSIPSGSGLTNVTNYEALVAYNNNGMNLGGWGGGGSTGASFFVGTIKDFRCYTRVLTEAELEQNRKVDEYRYFGRYVVTNVLVQSTYSYLEGYEKSGPYEVVDSYTFTAPETVTAPNGITYACDGYTVETPDGIGWAALASGTGNAYLYDTSAGTVRLTWRWKPVSGLRTAADYSLGDISPAGLALHYDGLLNQGVGVARSTTSTTWVNLGSRAGMDLTRATSGSDASKHGAWGEKGYAFGGYAQFQSSGGLPWPTTFSAQALVDAKHADNTHASGNYIAATTWKQFGMQIDGKRKTGRFNAQGEEDYGKRANYAAETGIDYMTAIHDAATKTAVVFPGTVAPTGGAVTDGYMHFDTFNGIENNAIRLGGWGGGAGSGQCLVGTLYTFRYYDRVITEEEIVRNRNVDAARYFGALGVTNVVVAVEEDSGVVPAETEGEAYFVEGSHAFTATGSAGVGYKLSVPDGDGGWRLSKSFTDGASFVYDKADSATPACVKIEWGIRKPFVIIVK
ncbi:MAG: hypothetical protein IJ783_02920 [Kiritimatiellae bacterium]|nr:hypothetical protein [Kiritimatiellia bacterium]